MAVELWSRKQGLVRPPETLLYAEVDQHKFPDVFRKRIWMWAQTAFERIEFGTGYGDVINSTGESFSMLYEGLANAYGRDPLVDSSNVPQPISYGLGPATGPQLRAHVLGRPDNEVMDFIDGVFQVSAAQVEACASAALAGEEAEEIAALLNQIFKEEGIGYRWTAGQIIRFDEPVTHDLAIEPAIELLSGGDFGAANDEFAAALDAYRSDRWRDAITNANAAFESVLKIQTGKPNLKAGPLIAEARRQGVIPGYLGGAVENLEKLMHAVPSVRGQEGPHGLADRPSKADQHLAQLILSVTASFILFLGRPSA